MRPALALLSGALLLLAGSRVGQAAPTDAAPDKRVELILGTTTAEADRLESSLREMLAAKGLLVATTRTRAVSAQDVAAAIAPPNEATPSVARVLVDLTVPDQATLFLIDPRRGRVHVRRMPLAHGLDAVARASVRFVVEQSIDAILEGRDIGMSREEFQRSVLPPAAPVTAAPPAPAPPTPPPAGPRWLIAAGYEAVAIGSGQVQQAARMSLAARFTRIRVAVAARFAAPLSVAGDGADARLWTGGAGASAAGTLLEFDGLSLSAGLGVGIDLIRVEPGVTNATLQPAAAFWASSPWLQPFARLERDFGRLSVALVAGAELHPLAERYTIRNGGLASDVFVPWRLRPSLALLAGAVF